MGRIETENLVLWRFCVSAAADRYAGFEGREGVGGIGWTRISE
jgi:hypothetical protein